MSEITGWQPIETAPKNKQVIMLFFPNGCDMQMVEKSKIGLGFWDTDDWYHLDSRGFSMTYLGEIPTHWMPLPDPPSTPGAA